MMVPLASLISLLLGCLNFNQLIMGKTVSPGCQEVMDAFCSSQDHLPFYRVHKHILDADKKSGPEAGMDPFVQAQSAIQLLVLQNDKLFRDPVASADAVVAFWRCREAYPEIDGVDHLYYLWRPIPIFGDEEVRGQVLEVLASRGLGEFEEIKEWINKMVLTDADLLKFKTPEGDFDDYDEEF